MRSVAYLEDLLQQTAEVAASGGHDPASSATGRVVRGGGLVQAGVSTGRLSVGNLIISPPMSRATSTTLNPSCLVAHTISPPNSSKAAAEALASAGDGANAHQPAAGSGTKPCPGTLLARLFPSVEEKSDRQVGLETVQRIDAIFQLSRTQQQQQQEEEGFQLGNPAGSDSPANHTPEGNALTAGSPRAEAAGATDERCSVAALCRGLRFDGDITLKEVAMAFQLRDAYDWDEDLEAAVKAKATEDPRLKGPTLLHKSPTNSDNSVCPDPEPALGFQPRSAWMAGSRGSRDCSSMPPGWLSGLQRHAGDGLGSTEQGRQYGCTAPALFNRLLQQNNSATGHGWHGGSQSYFQEPHNTACTSKRSSSSSNKNAQQLVSGCQEKSRAGAASASILMEGMFGGGALEPGFASDFPHRDSRDASSWDSSRDDDLDSASDVSDADVGYRVGSRGRGWGSRGGRGGRGRASSRGGRATRGRGGRAGGRAAQLATGPTASGASGSQGSQPGSHPGSAAAAVTDSAAAQTAAAAGADVRNWHRAGTPCSQLVERSATPESQGSPAVPPGGKPFAASLNQVLNVTALQPGLDFWNEVFSSPT
eukprot:gene6547-6774_t